MNMKKCKLEKRYNYKLKRCMRDGSLRQCKLSRCVHFRPTFFYRVLNKLKEVF